MVPLSHLHLLLLVLSAPPLPSSSTHTSPPVVPAPNATAHLASHFISSTSGEATGQELFGAKLTFGAGDAACKLLDAACKNGGHLDDDTCECECLFPFKKPRCESFDGGATDVDAVARKKAAALHAGADQASLRGAAKPAPGGDLFLHAPEVACSSAEKAAAEKKAAAATPPGTPGTCMKLLSTATGAGVDGQVTWPKQFIVSALITPTTPTAPSRGTPQVAVVFGGAEGTCCEGVGADPTHSDRIALAWVPAAAGAGGGGRFCVLRCGESAPPTHCLDKTFATGETHAFSVTVDTTAGVAILQVGKAIKIDVKADFGALRDGPVSAMSLCHKQPKHLFEGKVQMMRVAKVKPPTPHAGL